MLRRGTAWAAKRQAQKIGHSSIIGPIFLFLPLQAGEAAATPDNSEQTVMLRQWLAENDKGVAILDYH
jgi:hypothetical protein